MSRKVCVISLFYYFFSCFILALSLKMKYEKTWFIYVTSNKDFLKFSAAKTTKQNKQYI